MTELERAASIAAMLDAIDEAVKHARDLELDDFARELSQIAVKGACAVVGVVQPDGGEG